MRVLITLARDAGRTFTRRQLIDAAFGFDYDGGDRTIDTHVWSLRRKLAAMDGTTEWITTVHGYGYRFEERLT
ncbi:MAG: winged helix-turn-helix domain-containing protein [Dehalococcoidia bacterium]